MTSKTSIADGIVEFTLSSGRKVTVPVLKNPRDCDYMVGLSRAEASELVELLHKKGRAGQAEAQELRQLAFRWSE